MGLLCLAAVAAGVDDLPHCAGTIESRSVGISFTSSSATPPKYPQAPFVSIDDDGRAVRSGDGVDLSRVDTMPNFVAVPLRQSRRGAGFH